MRVVGLFLSAVDRVKLAFRHRPPQEASFMDFFLFSSVYFGSPHRQRLGLYIRGSRRVVLRSVRGRVETIHIHLSIQGGIPVDFSFYFRHKSDES